MELFIADIYFKKTEYETAMEFVKREQQEHPSEAEGHYLLGILYRLKGEQERADAEFEEVSNIVKRKPDAPMAFSINSFFAAGKK
jgi:Flp pilus assembly protein TadD